MYKYHASIYINYQDNYQDDFIFGINLKTGTKFKLLNCYIELNRGNNGKESELITITYFSENDDKEKAKESIEKSMLVLSYLLGFPIEDYCIKQENIDGEYEIELTRNYNKISHIELINNKVLELDVKVQALFYHNIKLINIAQKYNYMYGFSEEAFINYFKILENISVSKYGRDRHNLDASRYNLGCEIKEILEDSFGIKYTEAQIKNIENNAMSIICKIATDGVFFKISMFCKENNILADEQIIHDAIKLRNKISHGDYVRKDDISGTYSYISNLAYEFISHNFFNENYENICIESDMQTY